MTFFEPFSPFSIAIIVIVAVLYAYGAGKVRVSLARRLCFWAGLIPIYGVLCTGFDYYVRHEFFMGRLQHAILQHVGPFLIALAEPYAVLRAGWPINFISAKRLIKSGKWIGSFFAHPVTATILFDGVMFFWLVPSIHSVALQDRRVYFIMNWSTVITGLLFWGMAFNTKSRYSLAVRIIALLAAIPPQIAVGAVLAFAARDIYPIYSICGRAFGSVPALQDQQIGGIIFWLHGAMMSLIGAYILARRGIIAMRK